MKFFDRLLTIVITATLTSAVWIVFGTTLLKMAEDVSNDEEEPAAVEAALEPQTSPQALETPEVNTPLPDVSTPAAAAPVAQATSAPIAPEAPSEPAPDAVDQPEPDEEASTGSEDNGESEGDIAL